MSGGYESREALADKIDWEGGITEAINGYGISEEALPEGTPIEIYEAWKRIRAIDKDVRVIDEWLYGEGE